MNSTYTPSACCVAQTFLLSIRSGDVRTAAETQSLRAPESEVYITHDTAEQLVTRSPSVYRYIHERVDALSVCGTDVAGHAKTCRVVGRVEEIARRGRVAHRRHPLTLVVDLEIFALIGEGGPAVGDSVARIPGDLRVSAIRNRQL